MLTVCASDVCVYDQVYLRYSLFCACMRNYVGDAHFLFESILGKVIRVCVVQNLRACLFMCDTASILSPK